MSTAQLPQQKHYFDELAELFRTFAADTDGIYRGWLSQIVLDRSDRPGSRAADLGCGSGRFTDLLAARHQHVLAVDIAEREIDLAKAGHGQAEVRFEQRNLLDVTPEVDGRFDLVFTVNTVHHLRAHHIVLPHLLSLVAPGGDVVVVDIVDPGQWRSLDWHIAEAFRDAEESYRLRSKRPDIAAEVLRLRLHPTWLEHVTTNIPLRRDEFHRRYSSVFPGARFADLHKEVVGMHWHAPR
jgi:2-polyprenyl-3-methyl-5-hydroxy-6-metoxy-1,4-benzoquinol methylase